jgi:hypothetical protein
VERLRCVYVCVCVCVCVCVEVRRKCGGDYIDRRGIEKELCCGVEWCVEIERCCLEVWLRGVVERWEC